MGDAGSSMTVPTCARCERYACRAGRPKAAPDDCPMWGPFPAFDTLYHDRPLRQLAYHATRVEGAGYGHWTRLDEVVELAARLGVAHVGIGYCPDMWRALTLQRLRTPAVFVAAKDRVLAHNTPAALYATEDYAFQPPPGTGPDALSMNPTHAAGRSPPGGSAHHGR